MGNIIEHVRIMQGAYENMDAQINVINYVLQHQQESPIGGSAVYPLNAESADREFQMIKQKYKKTDGRQVFHMCLTYPDNTVKTREQALEDAKKVAYKIGTEFQNVYGLHENTDNIHVHFAVNSVNYNSGKKITSERVEELLSDL